MACIIKIDTKENLKTFLDVINAQNTLGLSREALQAKLEEVFDLKINDFNVHEVPEHLRDFSIFVELDDHYVRDWSPYSKYYYYSSYKVYTVDSFIAAKYKEATPRFAKLFKIPIPSCYKDILY